MKKYTPHFVGLLVAIFSTSYIIIQTYESKTLLEKIIRETPTNKLPMLVILSNMDVVDWSKETPDSVKFLHQYKIITNTDNPRKLKIKTTDFIEVTKKEFLTHYKNLDMEVASKIQSREGIKVSKMASPPGFAHCVGNKKYGQWKVNTKSGETTWQFHEKFLPLAKACGLDDFTIQNYYFTDYYKNYQGRKPYYGNRYTDELIRFGTYSQFSERTRRQDVFYGTDRERRVRNYYYYRDYKGTGMLDYIQYPVDKILTATNDNQLPLSVYLYDMDVEGSRYLHKYKIITNINDSTKRKATISKWQRVSHNDFVRSYDNLEMEIASKIMDSTTGQPKISKLPTPPGYQVYVDSPKYGSWQRRSDGTSFWQFHSRYAFMKKMFNMDTYPVYRSSYNRYRRNYYGRRAYYGGTGTSRRYGTGSTFSRSTSRSGYYSSERSIRASKTYKKYKAGRASRNGGRSGYSGRSRSGSSGK